MYKLTKFDSIVRILDGACISIDPANNDYAEYLKWCSIGNTPLPADQPTFAEIQAAELQKINERADREFEALTSSYPKYEVATWPNQYTEAKAYQADSKANTPTLTAIAQHAGIELPALSTSVLKKAELYTAASGAIVGKRKKAADVVDTATTNEGAKAWTW